MQSILFPMPTMNITTGINELSHVDALAIDCAGEDRGIDNVLAPFTGVIKKKWANGNTVWLQSVEPVLFADGVVDFATCAFTHDNSITNLSVGQVIQQGQVFYQEGTAGNATGNHVHLEIARGRFTGTGWHQNSIGTWVLNNAIVPWDGFWLDNVRIINGHNYSWKKLGSVAPNKGANNVADKINSDTWRILAHGVLARNGVSGRQNALNGSSDTEGNANHVGHDLTNAYVQGLFLSNEGRQWRDSQDDNSINGVNLRLATPQVVTIEKPVEVVKEVIKEVPVEKIVYQDKIVEVVKGDDERSLGDLLSAAFKKLFRVK